MTGGDDDSTGKGGGKTPTVIEAASAILLRDRHVLLVRRARGMYAGRWSAPGGRLEPGERAEQAAIREVREETSLICWSLVPLTVHTVDARGPDGSGSIFRISVFAGTCPPGTPVHGSDADAACLTPLDNLDGLLLTPGLRDLIGAAQRRLGHAGTASGK